MLLYTFVLRKDVSVYSNNSSIWFAHLGLNHFDFQTFSIHDFGKSSEWHNYYVYKNEYQKPVFFIT